MVTLFAEVVAQEGYQAAPPEVQAQIANDFFGEKVAVQEGYLAATPEIQAQIKQDFFREYEIPNLEGGLSLEQDPIENELQTMAPNEAMPDVSVQQGLQNLGSSFVSGIGDFAQAAINPETYQQMGQQAFDAIQTEQQAPWTAQLLQPYAMGLGAVQGVRDLGQGLLNLPADIANAYQGQQVYEPAVNLPNLMDVPVAGDLMQQLPASTFTGEQLPYMLPISRAAQATKLPGMARAMAEGAAIGATLPSEEGLKGRFTQAAMGATAPAVLGTGGKLAGKAIKKVASAQKAKQPMEPVGLQQLLPEKKVEAKIIEPAEAIPEAPTDVQAIEAKAIKQERAKASQGGYVRIGGGAPPQQRNLQLVRPKKAFDPKKAGVEEVVGTTKEEPKVITQAKEGLKDTFSYMHRVKDKSFKVGGKDVSGNKLIAEVDRLRTKMNKGYRDAELKVRNAIEHLEDTPNYKASDKVKDTSRYLFYSDYLRRSKEGMEVPGGLSQDELRKGLNAAQKHIRKNPDVRKAVLNVRKVLDEIGDQLVDAGFIEKKRRQYFPHQVLEHLEQRYGLPVKVQRPSRGYAKKAKGSKKAVETDLIEVMDSHLKAIARHNAIDEFIDRVIKDYAEPDWKLGQPLPEGFVEFQPRSGRQHFRAFSVPEEAVMQAAFEKLMLDPDPKVKASLEKVKQVIAVGAPRKTYALPKEVAHHLVQLYEPKNIDGLNNLIVKANRAWKGLVTGSPLNPGVIAFHFKNAIGDFENALRDDPGLSKYVGRATQEIYKAKKGNPTKSFKTAEEWGTIGAGYYGTELDLMTNDFDFKRRFSKSKIDRAFARTPIVSQASLLSGKFSDWSKSFGEAREDILRYAKFLRDTDLGLEPWQAHIENGRTFVNYSHLTPFEKNVLRDGLLPFYTFYKNNAVNWTQGLTGKRVAGAAARSAVLAFGFPFATTIWNQMIDPETEDLLYDRKSKRYLANQPHIITGFKDDKGNSIVITFPTASNAALQIFGLAKAPYRLTKALKQVMEGKRPMTETLKKQVGEFVGKDLVVEAGKDDNLGLPAPMAETLELINPFIKEGTEQLFDYDLFLGRPITRGDANAPEGENTKRRLAHVAKVVAPPFQRLGKLFNPNIDNRIKALDLLTGVVKAPDLYSWSDLRQEEESFKKEQQRIRSSSLRKFRERVKQSLYDEQRHAVYDSRIGPEELRFGKALSPTQRMRVGTLLKQSTQGDAMAYSSTSKYGLLKIIKEIDSIYQKEGLPPAEKRQLKKVEAALPMYLSKLNKYSEARIRAAVTAVKSTENKKRQLTLFKSLTRGAPEPPQLQAWLKFRKEQASLK